ncbi:glycosyltransferase family 2 protein [Vibrio fluvialis]|uniref:glycosyltransferase n=1 Tax=Vibrio fluvialis TaxID=676 RepID=UPI0006E460A1|nr:glycosyltransferase family 2 protein [Vibrio fluvialis]KQH83612.1 glycosyl transferase [Vibrio fluvialis]MBY8114020.1 glycosyltransferase family 2 protein [Vibrio fluvialis]MBY8297210.1 glycosyltransferase family 2 protein [Vibrio fluvialis]MBY8314094.1 glycosyltransferase family 2 protein [Vibrio fluvialis]MCE7643443.1 glycosyltransferase family 2 protein [Vibrio fluvialis]
MALFISVVNHGHDEMISSSTTLKNLAKRHTVIVKSNTQAQPCLKNYCQKADIHLIQGKGAKGFGANNNEVFDAAKGTFSMCDDDFFLVLNPDIEIFPEALTLLLQQLKHTPADISAINLFRDSDMTVYDNSIRRYPELLTPLKTLLKLQRNDFYDKAILEDPIDIDWAAGSFLLFKAKCYESLKGFDENYYMYFEDADICTRANMAGYRVTYFPNIKAVHFASHKNRKLFSRHFFWYWTSAFRYHFRFPKNIRMNA